MDRDPTEGPTCQVHGAVIGGGAPKRRSAPLEVGQFTTPLPTKVSYDLTRFDYSSGSRLLIPPNGMISQYTMRMGTGLLEFARPAQDLANVATTFQLCARNYLSGVLDKVFKGRAG